MSGRLYSMTGLGEAAGAVSPRLSARVRVWSVNSRGLEINLRFLPRGDYPELELACRREVSTRVSRGRVSLVLELKRTDWQQALRFNWEVAKALAQQLQAKPAELELAPLHFGELLVVPGFVEASDEVLTPEEQEGVLGLVGEALEALAAARAREAELLLPSLQRELAVVEGFAEFLAREGEGLRQALYRRLLERVSSLRSEGVDELRLAQEAALLAERSDVAEEQSRLLAHVAHFRGLLAEGGAVGRKLDFLVQEMLRELNTAGSKLREVGVGERLVEAKAAVERLREQCANLE
ncbi:MAG: hypothetical protein KatS3mg007_1675 [Thermoanaerobaculum sp.]|mgnify:CR=1 FL=1|uniref:DUF1732 domain-containing protein n=2 Tax=Thermoanaerobaculum aquaticum TaxID=1312852 RepID=A0A7C2NU01_9BACT|nr:MAG: hypothetical protein KatS3mg007_1675 [Thermoanaerobaculum sp.]